MHALSQVSAQNSRLRAALASVLLAGTALAPSMVTLGALGLPAPLARAEDAPTDAKAMFDRAVEVLRTAQSVSYSASVSVEGEQLARAYNNASARVSVRALRSSASQTGWVQRVQGSMNREAEATPIDIAWRESTVEGVDHAKKTVQEKAGTNTGGIPGANFANEARLRDMFVPQPFRLDLAAASYELEEARTIDGELCDVVLVTRAGGGSGKVRWAFARTDGLPRMYERVFAGVMQGTLRVSLSSVRIDANDPPAIKPEELRVSVPKGFTENRAAPAPTVTPAPVPTARPEGTQPVVQPAGEQPPAPAPQPKAPEQTGPRAAADFELSTPAGEKIKLGDLRGKVVVMQFWGSWCLPCREWHATLAGAAKAGAGEKTADLALLALAVRERDQQNAVAEHAARDASAFTLLLNADEVASQYAVSLYPTTLVIDQQGMIVAQVEGQTDEAAATAITDAVRAALGTQQAAK